MGDKKKEFDLQNAIENLAARQEEMKKSLAKIEKKISSSEDEDGGSIFGSKSKKEISKLKETVSEQEAEIIAIKSKLKVSESTVEKLETAIKQKDKELGTLAKQKDEELDEKNKQIAELTSSLNTVQKEKKSIETKYKTKYADIEKAYDDFSKLSAVTRNSLKNVFPSDTLQSFLAAGLQWENISALWDYTKRCFIEDAVTDTEKLRNIFLFFFAMYNEKSRKPEYVLISPNKGDKFDSDRHVVIGGKTATSISRCVFEGYCNSSGKQVFKALVQV